MMYRYSLHPGYSTGNRIGFQSRSTSLETLQQAHIVDPPKEQAKEKEIDPVIATDMPWHFKALEWLLKRVGSKLFSITKTPTYRLDAKVLHEDFKAQFPHFRYISLISPTIGSNLHHLTLHFYRINKQTIPSNEKIYQALEASLKEHVPSAHLQFTNRHRIICLPDKKQVIPIHVFIEYLEEPKPQPSKDSPQEVLETPTEALERVLKDAYSFGGVK